MIGNAERRVVVRAAFQRDVFVGDGHADVESQELGVGQRHAFAAAAETSKISTESSALRRETLREAGGRVRLDALELAEARPGDPHCSCLIDASAGVACVSVCPQSNAACGSTEMAVALQRSSLVFFGTAAVVQVLLSHECARRAALAGWLVSYSR